MIGHNVDLPVIGIVKRDYTDSQVYITPTMKEVDELMKIFSSFISEEISDFNTDVYYQNPDYLECSYRAGYLLD